MYSIRQGELFSFEDLLKMKPEDKYAPIFEHLDVAPVLLALGKTRGRGRPEVLNYPAMIYSLLIAKMEGIEFVSALVRRLRFSEEFRLQCRFTGSDRTPSEASYSRLITVLQQHGLLESVQDRLVTNALAEGFIDGTHIAVDSSAVEAWDCQYSESAAKRRASRRKEKQATTAEEQLRLEEIEVKAEPEPAPKKKPVFGRGGVRPGEMERRQKEREAYEDSLPVFEKKIENMIPFTYEELHKAMPRHASLCTKKNSKGKKVSWYGYKANVLVDTKSQYVLSGVLSSAHLNDQRMAVLLLKGLPLKFPQIKVEHVLGDKGYDSTPVYQLIRSLKAYPLIDFIHHTDPPEGMNRDFSPICKEGHVYRYDSFDPQYETLRYTRPNECKNCPFAETGCQKVFKFKLEANVRKHTYPARGSESFTKLYNKRTAVERVFAYLKGYFGLRRTRHRGIRATVDFQLTTLAFNLSKFAVDKMNRQLKQAA